MWPKTRVTDLLGIEVPIVQAGMAGGITVPELVAAVSNAGGLGSLGAGYMTPDQIRSAIRAICSLTDQPFAVNLFVPGETDVDAQTISRMNQMLQPYRTQLGIESPPHLDQAAESFEEQLEVVIEEGVPVLSFTFGIPSSDSMQELKTKHIRTIGTATTVKEATLLEQSGVDLIVAQGSEAGGHRGTFAGKCEDSLVGTMALVPQIIDHVRIPVIASGGIMDGRGIVASLALGASGVQMGTAFLTCAESGAHLKYKESLLHSTEESTRITRVFSGKPARGIKNAFMLEMEKNAADIPAYPVQNALTRDIRQATAKQNNPAFMSLWAGQASRLSKPLSASELMDDLVKQTEQILQEFRS